MLLFCVVVPVVIENGIAFILTKKCRMSAVLCFVGLLNGSDVISSVTGQNGSLGDRSHPVGSRGGTWWWSGAETEKHQLLIII